MADRITKIILRGDISDFQAKMVAAGRSVSAATDKITNASKESKKWRDGLSSVGDAAGKMGLVAAAGVGVVVAAAAKFDSSMSKVQAATHESAQNMELLRTAAINAGRDTVYSATEAADAITAMAKAGVGTHDILAGGLNGALSLASAGELDVAQSAEIAATAMNQFGLAGKDIPHIADLLAAGAGKAMGDVTDFAAALKYVGPVAHQMGVSIEEATGTIAELAQQGILGEQAGTSLRGMLTALTSPSQKARDTMDALGISLYNAKGNFIGFAGVAQQLREHLGKLNNATRDQALGQIFGNEQITAARVLYQGGAAAVEDWTRKVNDSGYAAKTAAIKMDNLKGDLENLKGSLETLLIGAGEGSTSFLRVLTQGATGAVNALNALPGPLKDVAMGMGAITAITGGGLFFGAKFVSGIADGRAALNNMGITAETTKTKLSTLGSRGLGFVADQAKAAGQAFEEMSGKQVALRGGAAVVGTLALSLNHLDDSADRATKTMGAFANIGAGALLGFAAGGPVGAAVGGGVSAITTLVGALHDGGDASKKAAEGASQYAGTLNDVTGAATGATRALVANRLEQQGILEIAQRTGLSTSDLVSGILDSHGAGAARTSAALADLRKQYAYTAEQQKIVANSIDPGAIDPEINKKADMQAALAKVSKAYGIETDAINQSKAATDRKAAAVGNATSASDINTLSTGSNTTALKNNAKAIQDEIKWRDKMTQAALDAFDAETAYQRALQEGADRQKERTDLEKQLADAQKTLANAKTPTEKASAQEEVDRINASLKDYKNTLDKTTKAGQANRDILSDMAKGWNALSDKQKDAKGAYHQARQDLIDQAKQFGATAKQARWYADHLLAVPHRITTKIMLDKQKAQAALDEFKREFYGLTPKTVALHLKTTTDKNYRQMGGVPGVATGGYITGPGTGTSDSIPAWLSNGEYVIKAAAVAKYGVDTLHRINAMRYANGGYVNRAVAAQSTTTNNYAGPSIDYDRLAAAMSNVRPLYGDVKIQPHNYGEFTRQMEADHRREAVGAVSFK